MKIYAAIDELIKNDDGTLTVTGVASSGAVDSDGEIITPEAMKAAIPAYMKWGAVREMHGKVAAGTALDAKVGKDGSTQFTALIVDPIAIKKVEAGVYKGFSIGGKVLSRDENDQNIITGINLIEVSLVDRPANPEALITMYKSEEVEDKSPEEIIANTLESEDSKEESQEKSETVVVEPEKSETEEVQKAGMRFSKDSAASVGEIHKAAMDICAKFDALGYKQVEDKKDDESVEMSASADLTKALETKTDGLSKALQAANDDLAKALEINAELKTQIEKSQAEINELKKQPAPPKAFRLQTAIGKGEDINETEKADVAPPEGTEAHAVYLMKKIYSGELKKA